ncbi:MAG: UDP-N-acetylmuramate--L-alanine ligase [Candidatus Omnitrophica bacterium]|nr:UDP-N-acetylmuramate--L-alanine ligase [Candidatus Omnitrophota bacterium]
MNIFEEDIAGKFRSAYFIGIGGVGMSALARVLHHRGLHVWGSDKNENHHTRELAHIGIPVLIGQHTVGFGEADLVVYSSAIDVNHIELRAARQNGRRVYHRAQILSSLMNHAPTSIAVTGTHGKTTTSSMISFVLSELGKNPTCLVGSDLVNLGSNAILGDSQYLVAEVDESDKSHRLYAPNYSIVTNLEEDHVDHYENLKDLENSFEDFFEHARNPGLIVYSNEDPVLSRLMKERNQPKISFGFSNSADFSAQNVHLNMMGSEFDLMEMGFFVQRMHLSVPGLHNIANALAATALLIQLGLEIEAISEALSRFRGTRRRLEIKWQSSDMMVIDDYAHHPTEVRASIKALRNMGKPVTVIFQPHRFSRTKHFYRDFGLAFAEADEVILTDIYGAGEMNIEGINSGMIFQEILKSGHSLCRMITKGKVLDYLSSRQDLSGIVAFLGAGDIGDIADEFANRFKSLATA